jgi:hypothetical protein
MYWVGWHTDSMSDSHLEDEWFAVLLRIDSPVWFFMAFLSLS